MVSSNTSFKFRGRPRLSGGAIIWGRLFRNPRLWLPFADLPCTHFKNDYYFAVLSDHAVGCNRRGFHFFHVIRCALKILQRFSILPKANFPHILPSLRTSQLHTNRSPYTKLSVATETPISYLLPGIWDSALPSLETRQLLLSEMRRDSSEFSFFQRLNVRVAALPLATCLWHFAAHSGTATRAWAREVNEVRIQICQCGSSLDSAW